MIKEMIINNKHGQFSKYESIALIIAAIALVLIIIAIIFGVVLKNAGLY